jgi:hypothetical protein
VAACAASALAALKVKLQRRLQPCNIMTEINFFRDDMAMIYMSPDLYFDAFEQPILTYKNLTSAGYTTAGLSLYESGG